MAIGLCPINKMLQGKDAVQGRQLCLKPDWVGARRLVSSVLATSLALRMGAYRRSTGSVTAMGLKLPVQRGSPFLKTGVTVTTSNCRQGCIFLNRRQLSNQLPWTFEYLTGVEGLQQCCQTRTPRHECWVVRQVLVEGMQYTESKHNHIAQNSLPRL